uniref:HIG1 domain-containing protein n=1 Tax=Angiostrongylus cantonensis TaxID=6313 RepID=A0A0K0DEB7_ANGCA
MPESLTPSHASTDYKQHMKWLVEREKYRSAVPMIPQDFSQGSHSKRLSTTVLNRAISNPFVPLGMVATVGCLMGMALCNSKKAQLYMRGRCLAQGLTVVALVGGALLFGIAWKGQVDRNLLTQTPP